MRLCKRVMTKKNCFYISCFEILSFFQLLSKMSIKYLSYCFELMNIRVYQDSRWHDNSNNANIPNESCVNQIVFGPRWKAAEINKGKYSDNIWQFQMQINNLSLYQSLKFFCLPYFNYTLSIFSKS